MSATTWRVVVVLVWAAALIAFAAAVLRAHEGEAAHGGPSVQPAASPNNVVRPISSAVLEHMDWG